jgi:hypothetical protein
MRLRQFFKNYFPIFIGGITLHSYYMHTADRPLIKKLEQANEASRKSFEKVIELQDKIRITAEKENEVTQIATKAIEELDHATELINNNKDTLTEDVQNVIADYVISSHEKLVKILNINTGESQSNKFIGGDWISNVLSYYNNFMETIQTLTLLEQTAVYHIIISFSIIIVSINILLIFYGELFIKYLKIEERFPRLAVFITLRYKFQQFHLLISICYIIIISLGLIFVDMH